MTQLAPVLDGPRYWMFETTGRLKPVVQAYLAGEELDSDAIVTLRAYLRQWINAPVWKGEQIDHLRAAVDGLVSRQAIANWIHAAEREGIDPL